MPTRHDLRSRSKVKKSCLPSLTALAIVAVAPVSAGNPRKAQSAAAGTRYEPTSKYAQQEIEGWPVLVNKGFLKRQPALAQETLLLLQHQLYQIARRVPAASVKKLRTIRIWVEEEEPHHPCMTYHPDKKWLIENGMNPEKARSVEVANARNFLKWTLEQPWMVLHELSHGFHHQFLERGFDNPEVKARYDRAVKAGRYNTVERITGKSEKAYAVTDRMEYFAEASEAFFGTNDFFPFVRPELERHDPEMFKLLKKLWKDG
jgi:hypothetical protein